MGLAMLVGRPVVKEHRSSGVSMALHLQDEGEEATDRPDPEAGAPGSHITSLHLPSEVVIVCWCPSM
jgi:hypothetical protein